MKTFKQTYTINTPKEKVWQALVDPKIIDDWGAGPAKMSEEEGAEFSIWGGDIHGKNIEVKKGEKLVQDWIEGDWDEFSRVTFLLSGENGKTKVELLHENVPDKEAEELEDGWKRYYLDPLKDLLEKFS
ncbi:SRPBCC domain-containing protein [Candidatus Daviesbacteria bacterium]|nr:SRPBCC domain-containing protein [Candidatus Daviesbacteria bacterium]